MNHLFEECALAAYVDECRESGRFPPALPAVRHRANRYFEAELAKMRLGRSERTIAQA